MLITFIPLDHTIDETVLNHYIWFKKSPRKSAISATANANGFTTLTAIAGCYGWDDDLITKASEKCNELNEVLIVNQLDPVLLLVPKTKLGNNTIKQIEDLIAAANKLKISSLHFTHYGLTNNFPTNEVNEVLEKLLSPNLDTTIKTIYWDVDSRAEGEIYDIAIKHYKLLAEQGVAEAQQGLGIMYQYAPGFQQNINEAIRYYKLAAEQGLSDAQNNLGLMFHDAQGVQQDYTEAVKWYRLAAAQNNALAQYNLGVMYANGRGVPQDKIEAFRWYKLAAELGLAEGQINLGFMYEKGISITQDYSEAFKWYKLSAEQGLASAQYNLAVMYGNGRGTTQDMVEAIKWYKLAAAQGHATAKNNLSILSRIN